MAKATAKSSTAKKRGRPTNEETKIINIDPETLKKGTRGKVEEFWEEPWTCGEHTSMIKVTCTVDAVKCTFKVKSHFTTKQFHIYNEDEQIALLQAKATLELKAGQWGVQTCQHYNEMKTASNPNQLNIGSMIPNQSSDGGTGGDGG